MRHRQLLTVAAFLVAAVTVCSSARTSSPGAGAPSARLGSTLASSTQRSEALLTGTAFLTISRAQTPGRLVVQLRSGDDGHVLSSVFTASSTTTQLSVDVASDGSVLAAQTSGCSTTVVRVDPDTGRAQTLRTIDEDVSDVAVSPDGTKIAYITHLKCSTYACPTTCAGPMMSNPNVLVVMDLVSGQSARTATDDPGHPLRGPTWSPDGKSTAAIYYGGDTDRLLLYDAARPRFAAATPVRVRAGCSYSRADWTAKGILAVESCDGPSSLLSPATLVQTTPAGAVLAAWPLPGCSDGIRLASTPARLQTLIEADIGYGNGSCATPQANGVNPLTRILQIVGPALRPVIDLHDALQVMLAGY